MPLTNHPTGCVEKPIGCSGTDVNRVARLQNMQFFNNFQHDVRDFADPIRTIGFYTTDVDAFLENYDVYAGWISEAGIRPPQTLLGIARLAAEDLMIEIEAEAAA